jgi:hypothetical protein
MSHEYELAVTSAAALMENLLEDVDAATNARHKGEKERAAGAVNGTARGGEAS